MLSYEEMQYLTAFAECSTLTEVAEKYNISQPTITRDEESGRSLRRAAF